MATTMAARATVTATSSRPVARLLTALGAGLALATAGCATTTSATAHESHGADAHPVPAVPVVAASLAPASWHHAALPDGGAVLAYPPSMHAVSGDKGEVSAARFGASGAYLLYLNATPKQGNERLRNWPAFRLGHLLDDDASAARLLAQSSGVRFLGGTGSCVLDAYITKVKAHHFTEIACLVQGRTSESVVVAAAPTADWATESGPLIRAIAAYQVR